MTSCRLCSKKLMIVTNTHLSKHGFTLAKYTQRFGKNGVGFARSISDIPKDDPRYISWRKSLEKRDTGWARGYTKETHPSLAKMVATFKKRKIDNFKNWREEARLSGKISNADAELNKDAHLAFLIGMTLGDGNIYRFPRTEYLRITLASKYP